VRLGSVAWVKRVGVVVPTLGQRPDLIVDSLRSIRSAGNAYTIVVGPSESVRALNLSADLIDEFVSDPGGGAAAAINAGLRSMPDMVEFVSWLGDDDLLEPGALVAIENELVKNDKNVAGYGMCRYINVNGEVIGQNRSGSWAVGLAKWGPDLIPQPGSLIRRRSLERLGGLNETLKWAFDLDLFLRLARDGNVVFCPQWVSSFRWHPGSLTAGQRQSSIQESRQVRQAALRPGIRKVSWAWERPLCGLSWAAGLALSRRAQRNA
jgi:hypothetical protein